MQTGSAVELPCTKCGDAAVSLALSGLLEIIPGRIMFAIKGAARVGGASIDTTSPTLGFDPKDIADAIGATCIACVDKAAAAVDNNPEQTS